MKRRRFLSFLAVAPAAAPVAAKEAALRMGLLSGVAASLGASAAPMTDQCGPVPMSAETDWVKDRVTEFFSPERAESRVLEAKGAAFRLDSDLAALRSVSPSWAYCRQVDRCHARIERQELSWLSRLADKSGLGWMLPGSARS